MGLRRGRAELLSLQGDSCRRRRVTPEKTTLPPFLIRYPGAPCSYPLLTPSLQAHHFLPSRCLLLSIPLFLYPTQHTCPKPISKQPSHAARPTIPSTFSTRTYLCRTLCSRSLYTLQSTPPPLSPLLPLPLLLLAARWIAFIVAGDSGSHASVGTADDIELPDTSIFREISGGRKTEMGGSRVISLKRGKGV